VTRLFRRDFLKRLAALPGLAFLSALPRPAAASVPAAPDFENRPRPPGYRFHVEGPGLPDALRGVTFQADVAKTTAWTENYKPSGQTSNFFTGGSLVSVEMDLRGVRGSWAAVYALIRYLGDVRTVAGKTLHFEGDGLRSFVAEAPLLRSAGDTFVERSRRATVDLSFTAADVRPA
jgi:hypothetical protein